MQIYLKNRQFRALTNSRFLSAIGSVLFNLVFLVYAQTLPFKTLALSLVSFANLLPTLLMIVNGYWADHTPPRKRLRAVLGLRGVQGVLYLGLALLIQQPGTLWTFTILLLINLGSDLVADYTEDLLLHYEKSVLPEQSSYQDALGFSAGVGNIISMLFQAVGASLIVLLHNNFALFGVINATSFLLAGGVLLRDRRTFAQIDQAATRAQQTVAADPESLHEGIWHALRIVYADRPMFAMVMLALGVNTLGTAQDGLASVLLANTPRLWFGTFGTTIALISIASSLAMTAAALFMHDGLQHASLPALTAISLIALVFFAIDMVWWQQPLVMVVTMTIASYPLGKINPRLQSDVFAKVDAQHLASTISVISTVSLIGAPLGNVVFLGIANLSTPQLAWVAFGVCALALAIAAILVARRFSHAATVPSAAEIQEKAVD